MGKTFLLNLNYWIFFVLLLLFSGFFYFNHPVFFPIDDAYIILHNASVLLQGNDINYPNTPALFGTTSPVFLLLVSLLIKLTPFSPSVCLGLLNWSAIFLYTLGILKLCKIFHANTLQTLAVVFLALFTGSMPYQLLNGLETGLALAGLTWLLVGISQPQPSRHQKISVLLLCGLLPFIRPEFILLTALTGLYYLHKNIQEKKYKNILIDLSLILFAALPWIAWLYYSTGHVYPMTAAAKTAFFAFPGHFDRLHIDFLWGFLETISLPILLLILLTFFTPLRSILGSFVVLMGIVFFKNSPLLMIQNYFRYLYIFVPIALYSGLCFIQHSKYTIRISLNTIIALGVIQQLIISPVFFYKGYWCNVQYERYTLPNVTNWCKIHLPKQTIILVQDAGYLAYASSFHLIDFVGLKSPESLRLHQEITLPSKGKNRISALSKIALESHGEYIILTPEWNNLFNLITGLKKLGWQCQQVHQTPGENGYLIYKIAHQPLKERNFGDSSSN